MPTVTMGVHYIEIAYGRMGSSDRRDLGRLVKYDGEWQNPTIATNLSGKSYEFSVNEDLNANYDVEVNPDGDIDIRRNGIAWYYGKGDKATLSQAGLSHWRRRTRIIHIGDRRLIVDFGHGVAWLKGKYLEQHQWTFAQESMVTTFGFTVHEEKKTLVKDVKYVVEHLRPEPDWVSEKRNGNLIVEFVDKGIRKVMRLYVNRHLIEMRFEQVIGFFSHNRWEVTYDGKLIGLADANSHSGEMNQFRFTATEGDDRVNYELESGSGEETDYNYSISRNGHDLFSLYESTPSPEYNAFTVVVNHSLTEKPK